MHSILNRPTHQLVVASLCLLLGAFIKLHALSFYVACNSIFLHSSVIKNDMTLLHLQETYSLSVLMYAIPALLLTTRQWMN